MHGTCSLSHFQTQRLLPHNNDNLLVALVAQIITNYIPHLIALTIVKQSATWRISLRKDLTCFINVNSASGQSCTKILSLECSKRGSSVPCGRICCTTSKNYLGALVDPILWHTANSSYPGPLAEWNFMSPRRKSRRPWTWRILHERNQRRSKLSDFWNTTKPESCLKRHLAFWACWISEMQKNVSMTYSNLISSFPSNWL